MLIIIIIITTIICRLANNWFLLRWLLFRGLHIPQLAYLPLLSIYLQLFVGISCNPHLLPSHHPRGSIKTERERETIVS